MVKTNPTIPIGFRITKKPKKKPVCKKVNLTVMMNRAAKKGKK